MGVDVELVEGVGPVVARPVETMADVDALRVPEPEEAVPFVLETVRLVREQLEPERAVIGFCGGPFTVAGYLVEGRPVARLREDEGAHVRRARTCGTRCWRSSRRRSPRYVAAQVSAGADVVQVFDSWAGALSVEDYAEFAARYSARILGAVAAPTIHFATGATHLLPLARRGRRRRDRARLAHCPSTTAGSAVGARPRRAGQPRPGGAARAVGRASRRPPAPCSNGRPAVRGTSSTWATASCRRPTRPR